MPTIIYRHRKENRKKCTLTPLEKSSDYLFLTYPTDTIDHPDTLLLSLEGKELSTADRDKNLLILDSLWRYLPKMQKSLPPLETRSLPKGFRTAYPRKQDDCQDPARGLASIEAIYIANTILQKEKDHLLDHYYFKKRFLELNNELLHFYEKDKKQKS